MNSFFHHWSHNFPQHRIAAKIYSTLTFFILVFVDFSRRYFGFFDRYVNGFPLDDLETFYVVGFEPLLQRLIISYDFEAYDFICDFEGYGIMSFFDTLFYYFKGCDFVFRAVSFFYHESESFDFISILFCEIVFFVLL